MSESRLLAQQLNIRPNQVQATVAMLDDGNTVPFIARYRKEATGGLSDEQVSDLAVALKRLRALNERRETIKKAIAEQGKLSEKLEKALNSAETLADLEDLYAPHKKKRETRGVKARKLGLTPLAVTIFKQLLDKRALRDYASDYINPKTPTAAHVWSGARDIVAEVIADNASLRQAMRRRALQRGRLKVSKIKSAEDPKEVYKLYYDFEQGIDYLRPHQIMAINRGEAEKILRVKLQMQDHDIDTALRNGVRLDKRSVLFDQLQEAVDDAVKRLIMPAAERDVRKELTESAETHAIQVFATNMRGLLTQPPVAGHNILAIDPGFRSGCKTTALDATGKVLDTGTIFPHKPQSKRDDALKRLAIAVKRHNISLVAIGNGTASRETEKLVAELTRSFDDLKYIIVSEAGASVYSASALARAELPDMDVSMRGAVSIGRRVQDPLAELVKIDPKSIGVGLYQHDVNQKQLSEALEGVVEIVVNRVGVDLNTASPALLTHVAGIGPKLADKIVAHRDKEGPFENRSRVNKVSGLGKKAYEQCAGFLRIRDGSNPLDATAIHPESYAVARDVMNRANIKLDMSEDEKIAAFEALPPVKALAADLKVGEPTLRDILDQLIQPGRDPREDLDAPLLRSDILSMDDLQPGLELHGTVRNVVDFGAFIDIGVKRDGLLHRSATPRGTILSVGQTIKVAIKEVDANRSRISLDWVKS